MAVAQAPIQMQEDLNPFRIAMRQFDTAAEKLNLDAGMREVLRRPHRWLTLSLPVKMDDGSVRSFHAYRGPQNTSKTGAPDDAAPDHDHTADKDAS